MPNLLPSEIVNQVEVILQRAHQNGSSHGYLTAYQILDRLPEGIKSRIISERTMGGAGAGVYYAAPSVVSDAAEMVPNVQIEHLDCQEISIVIAGTTITPGNQVCGLYRL